MKSTSLGWVAAALAAVIFLGGCYKSAVPNDAAVAADVQARLSQDSRVTGSQIGVQADHGVVTLTGTVGTDAERAWAAGDAAMANGVRTVVNNLLVQEAQATPPPPAPEEAPRTPAPAKKPSAPVVKAKPQLPPPAPTENANTPPAPAPVPAAAQAPPPPPAPKKFAIPAGTQLSVRLNDALDTERNQIGDTFHGTLGAPIVIDGETVIPSGADVSGHVIDVKSAGRFAGNSALTLELNSLSVNGKTYNIQTNQWSRQGKGEGKNTAIKAGGGAALGALIGGLAGGGKGAAIGAGAGAGAGTGVAATKKGEQVKLPAESTLSFLLTNSVTVTQQVKNDRDAGRGQLP